MVEEVKSQTNVGKTPITCNLPFNNDANDDKQTNKHLEQRTTKARQKSLSHIDIKSIRNKLDSLFEFTYSLVNFLAVSET